jgi:hypothetical protein
MHSFVRLLALVLAMGVLLVGAAAHAELGAGTLAVIEAPYDYDGDFFILQIGVTYTIWIAGALESEIGGPPLPETIPVWVKSPSFGNSMQTATLLHRYPTYAFTYTTPFDACGAATVSYGTGTVGGYDARSPCFGPSWWCWTYPRIGEVRFIDSSGTPVACPATGVDDAAWTSVKKLYRD